MKRVLEEQDDVMANQAQEIDDRQAEIKSLSSEMHTWREKCSFAEKELERKKTEIANLKEETLTFCEENKRLDKLSEEIKKLKVNHVLIYGSLVYVTDANASVLFDFQEKLCCKRRSCFPTQKMWF